ncbi:MAG: chemotaxis protein CheC [Lachnospiraceae bacterium]|nr:chemotaxis protein CheC [Lachnospiraceae bacterium]
MNDISVENMSSQYYDVLKEIGNIGAGNATTALATMLQCKVDMGVPEVRLLKFSEIGQLLGGEEQVMAGVYLAIEGDINGSIMFLVKEDVAMHLIRKLLGDMTSDTMGEMEKSALKEISNIITGAYLNAMSSMTNLSIVPSIPDLCIDMAGAILSVPAIEFGELGDEMLLIQSQIYDQVAIDGFFIMVPDMESYKKILTALGMTV